MKKSIATVVAAAGSAALAASLVTPAQAASVVVPPSKATGTLVDLATNNGNFTTLLAAVGCADPAVGAALTSGDQYTVFAPTDAAFAATLGVTAATVCSIDQDLLTTVLLYHVTDGRRFSNSVLPKGEKLRTISTLADISFKVSKSGAITDGNDLTTPSIVSDLANLPATNGVVHVVDEVLLPINL